jgi:hypothetical protein
MPTDIDGIEQVSSSGGGGGGAVTIVDGGDAAEGSVSDAAWVAGNGTVIALLKKIASAGGSAVSIADGSDVTEGAIADVAVTGDNPGTVSAKLRGLNKSIAAGLAVTNTNLDVALSTRLKPADTLAAVTSITNPVAVTNAGLTNLDVALSTRTKPSDQQHAIIDSGVVTESYATSNIAATWNSGTAINTAITLSTLGLATANISIRKTGTITAGSLFIEISQDGTNYDSLQLANGKWVGVSAANPYILATGLFPLDIFIDVAAYLSIRLRLNPAIVGAGSIDVRIDGSAASNSTPVGTVTISGTVQQGNNNSTIAQSWNTKVTDGTTGPTKVQPASTAPVATDLALTVALSPNGAIVQANAGTNLNTSALALDATLTGRTAKVQITDGTRDGTVKAASTLPVLTDTAVVTTQRDPLPAGTNVIGHAIIDTGSTTAVTQATPANLQATVTPVTALVKGTQGATGFSVQRLNDAGRNTRIFMLDAITAAPLVEALATVVQWYNNAAVAGTTTPAVVPAGKTLRLTGYKIQYQSLATVGYAVVRIRFNTAGVAVLASPLVASFEAGSGAGATTVAMTGGITTETGSFPEGLELPAAGGIGFSVAGYGPTGTLTLEGGVRFEVHGYEY